jgi:SpoVK/Ycf46/Vps4 family AAA+-type ATPase
MTPEREAALLAIKEAAERLERTTRARDDAWRDFERALADWRKADGQHLRVEALTPPILRTEKWHP